MMGGLVRGSSASGVRVTRALPHLAFAIAALLATTARADNQPPVIAFEPCTSLQRGRAFTVFARITDESPIFEPKLVYRGKNDAAWKNVPLIEEAGVWKGTVPSRDVRGSLEYFLEAFDENGNGPTRVGSPEQPLDAKAQKRAGACAMPPSASVAPKGQDDPEAYAVRPVSPEVTTPRTSPSDRTVTEPAEPTSKSPIAPMTAVSGQAPAERSSCDASDPPIYCEVWFWAVVGGVVASGAGAAAYFLTRPSEEGGIPDYVSLEIIAGSPTSANPLLRGGW
jgi:hypothetical protein